MIKAHTQTGIQINVIITPGHTTNTKQKAKTGDIQWYSNDGTKIIHEEWKHTPAHHKWYMASYETLEEEQTTTIIMIMTRELTDQLQSWKRNVHTNIIHHKGAKPKTLNECEMEKQEHST